MPSLCIILCIFHICHWNLVLLYSRRLKSLQRIKGWVAYVSPWVIADVVACRSCRTRFDTSFQPRSSWWRWATVERLVGPLKLFLKVHIYTFVSSASLIPLRPVPLFFTFFGSKPLLSSLSTTPILVLVHLFLFFFFFSFELEFQIQEISSGSLPLIQTEEKKTN